jgi:L-threonylcarbamoyladenylate synthase
MGAMAIDGRPAVPGDAADVLSGGGLAVLPTDTVYGIACAAADADACRRIYALKARPPAQATAVMLGSVDCLLARLPGMGETAAAACRALLPGPYTLVVPNPAGEFAYLCGDAADRIGVRVPVLDPVVAHLADACGGIAITSANERGGPDPARLDDVPSSLRSAAAFEVDGGPLHGVASTVIDVAGDRPLVLREGPGLARALELLR